MDDFVDDFPGLHQGSPSFQLMSHKRFREGLLASPLVAKIVTDSQCYFTRDSIGIYDSITRMTLFLDTSNLNPEKLYLARTPLVFANANQISTSTSAMKTVKFIGAYMGFGVYDPSTRRIIFSASKKGKSHTFVGITSIVTKGDWESAATELGSEVKSSLMTVLKLSP